MGARRWIFTSPRSIWAMMRSMSCSSRQRSQNTALYSAVLYDLFESFAPHLFGDILDVVAPILFVGLEEMVEFTLCSPISSSFRCSSRCTLLASEPSSVLSAVRRGGAGRTGSPGRWAACANATLSVPSTQPHGLPS
jgi:hypothetical protein